MRRTSSITSFLSRNAALLILLLCAASKGNADEECDTFPSELASCFFALGGGYTPFGGQIPQPQTMTPECFALYEEYFKQDGQYWKDTETAIEAGSPILENEGNYTQMIIFDIDETSLSNLPLFLATNSTPTREEWQEWLLSADAPAIPATLDFYRDLIAKGYSMSFITGRRELARNATIANLLDAGYGKQCVDVPASPGAMCYVNLIMRADDDDRDATVYKSEERGNLKAAGFYLVASVGDQWSDLLGTDSPLTLIKMPNPLYYTP